MKKLIAALVVLALLGGCVKMDKSAPKDLPAYVSVYPGATPMMSMNMGALSSFVFQTTAKPDDVISYYRSQASSDGLPETSAPTPAGAPADQRQATFGDPTGDRLLVVVARPQGDASIVSLTYKPAPKASS